MRHVELLSAVIDCQLSPQSLEDVTLSYECDDECVTVEPYPSAQDAQAMDVCAFVAQVPLLDNPSTPETFRMLLQLNGEGLLHHGWMIACDEEGVINLRRLLPLEGLDTAELERWVGQAMELAASLRELVGDHTPSMGAGGANTDRQAGQPAPTFGMIRA